MHACTLVLFNVKILGKDTSIFMKQTYLQIEECITLWRGKQTKNFFSQYLQNYVHYIQKGKSEHVQHLCLHGMLSVVIDYL